MLDQQLHEIQQNSFKNFHAKGLDYICLVRSDKLTIKYYFFDGDHTKLPEVVNPHDHRYLFYSRCLAGKVLDRTFTRVRHGGKPYNEFAWDTPLNGGNGFTFLRESFLDVQRSVTIGRKSGLWTPHNAIHTIEIKEDQSILRLYQYKDALPIGTPTSLFTKHDAAPDTSGLYEKFTIDEIIDRLAQIAELP
jgi:hypothetical protein